MHAAMQFDVIYFQLLKVKSVGISLEKVMFSTHYRYLMSVLGSKPLLLQMDFVTKLGYQQ